MGSLDYCIFLHPHHHSCSVTHNLYTVTLLTLLPFTLTLSMRALSQSYIMNAPTPSQYLFAVCSLGFMVTHILLRLHARRLGDAAPCFGSYSGVVYRHAGSSSIMILTSCCTHLILFTFLFLFFSFHSCATTRLLHVCTVHTITYNSVFA